MGTGVEKIKFSVKISYSFGESLGLGLSGQVLVLQ